MKLRIKLIIILNLLLVASAAATGWQVIASYGAPAPNARGVVRNVPPFTNTVSVLCDGSPPRIYDLFNAARYINLAMPRGAWGLAPVTGGRMWVTNNVNSYVYTLTTTGSLISSFRCPKDHPADIGNGSWRWIAIPNENLAIQLNAQGSIISTFAGPGSRFTGYFGRGLGDNIIGDPATHKLYFSGWGTANLSEPIGVWASETTGEPPWRYIFVVDKATNYIFWFGWSGQQPVSPASLGRVKALYR